MILDRFCSVARDYSTCGISCHLCQQNSDKSVPTWIVFKLAVFGAELISRKRIGMRLRHSRAANSQRRSAVNVDNVRTSRVWMANIYIMYCSCFLTRYPDINVCSTLTAVGRSQLLARWSGTHSWILSGIQRAAQTVLGICLKRRPYFLARY